MKKLALTSVLAMVAVSGAHAANIIDGNPLYRPDAGRAYSVTSVYSHSKDTTGAGLEEELGYSFTDRLLARVSTSGGQNNWFETNSWDDLSVGLDYRFFNGEQWKADIFGSYTVMGIRDYNQVAFDKDNTEYAWTVGGRVGFIDPCGWTLALHAAFDYANTESFNWNDDGWHQFRLGVDGQVVLNREWALVGGVEYITNYEEWDENPGFWTATVGANYNLNEKVFVGGFIGKEMAHAGAGNWEVQDGFIFGGKFGIDF